MSAACDSAWAKGQGRFQSPRGSFPHLSTQRTGWGKCQARCRSWLPSLLHIDCIPWEILRSELRGHCIQCWPLALLPRCHGQCGWTNTWGWLDHNWSRCACLFEQADTLISGPRRAEPQQLGEGFGPTPIGHGGGDGPSLCDSWGRDLGQGNVSSLLRYTQELT